jgi:hypothetical protein
VCGRKALAEFDSDSNMEWEEWKKRKDEKYKINKCRDTRISKVGRK